MLNPTRVGQTLKALRLEIELDIAALRSSGSSKREVVALGKAGMISPRIIHLGKGV